jgi:signal peptidase II
MNSQTSGLKNHLADYAVLVLIAGIIVSIDQLTKSAVRHNLALGEVYLPEVWLSQYVRILQLKIVGAATGIFQDMGQVLTVFPLVVAAVIVYCFPRISRRDWLIRLALGLYLGGALGNLIDRLTQRYVTDFISVGSFPVFNVADACVSCGVVALLLGVWLHDRAKNVQKAELSG